MDSPIKTISDAGQAIAGISAKVAGLQWVVGGCAAAGFLMAGGLMVTTYNLGQSVASLTTAMQGTQAQMTDLRQEMAGLRRENKAGFDGIRQELAMIREALAKKGIPVEPTNGGLPEKQGNLEPIQSNGDGKAPVEHTDLTGEQAIGSMGKYLNQP